MLKSPFDLVWTSSIILLCRSFLFSSEKNKAFESFLVMFTDMLIDVDKIYANWTLFRVTQLLPSAAGYLPKVPWTPYNAT